jgi:hypothetical protein
LAHLFALKASNLTYLKGIISLHLKLLGCFYVLFTDERGTAIHRFGATAIIGGI